ncbi:hypothetical protein [Zhihengliuella halotolerans]|uniref:hypothetical protein n=1 Tax=Zhihengliuella halotolerans TaxID=370736 RepID=UPI0011AEC803|nr:hypothetical protein [Zhihengliuella halotolerans]
MSRHPTCNPTARRRTPEGLAAAFADAPPGRMLPPGPRENRWEGDVTPPGRAARVPAAAMVAALLHSPRRHLRPDGGETRIPLRSVPSAGACQPVTAHVICGDDCDLPPGRYAFEAVSSRWVRRDAEPHAASRTGASPLAQPFVGAAVLLTAAPRRTQARYWHRSPPLLIADGAFTAVALALAARGLGLQAHWRRSGPVADEQQLARTFWLPAPHTWETHWPGTVREVPLARIDVTPSGALLPEVDVSASGVPEAPESPVAPAACAPSGSAPQTQESVRVPADVPPLLHPAAPDLLLSDPCFVGHGLSFDELAARRSAEPSASSVPGVPPPQPTALCWGPPPRGADVVVLDAHAAAAAGLGERCSGQHWVEQCPWTVVYTADSPAAADDPAVHWWAGLSAAQLTYRHHAPWRVNPPAQPAAASTPTRAVAGWTHVAGRGPVLGLTVGQPLTSPTPRAAAAPNARRIHD